MLFFMYNFWYCRSTKADILFVNSPILVWELCVKQNIIVPFWPLCKCNLLCLLGSVNLCRTVNLHRNSSRSLCTVLCTVWWDIPTSREARRVYFPLPLFMATHSPLIFSGEGTGDVLGSFFSCMLSSFSNLGYKQNMVFFASNDKMILILSLSHYNTFWFSIKKHNFSMLWIRQMSVIAHSYHYHNVIIITINNSCDAESELNIMIRHQLVFPRNRDYECIIWNPDKSCWFIIDYKYVNLSCATLYLA